MSKLQFTAPKISLGHASLLRFAASHGVEADVLRQLLWLTNAHPDLLSHARIFQNLSAIFASPVFFRDCVTTWASDWTDLIPAWIECTRLLSHNKTAISRQSGLGQFDLKAPNTTHHPLSGLGLVRHAISGALWNVTELLSQYPPPAWDGSASAAFFRLQAHFLAAVVESRHRLSSLEFYEQYDGELERPIAPTVNSAISPSIRELSYANHAPLLELFPVTDSTVEYARQFQTDRFDLDSLEASYRGDAKKLVATIARFFQRFLKVLHGWRPAQNSRFGATYLNRTGHLGARSGFIPSSEVAGVYRRESPTLDDIPSPAKTVGATLFISRDPAKENSPLALEKSGLVPKARPEVTRQTAAIKCLTSMVRKDMTKTGCSIDIFTEITQQSRTLSDISFGRLIDLFELAGFNNQERIAAELPGFVAWAKDEVDYFNSQIQPAWKVEPKSPNFEINLDHSVNRKPPVKPQKKLGQRLTATIS